jgi:hypothetical protein
MLRDFREELMGARGIWLMLLAVVPVFHFSSSDAAAAARSYSSPTHLGQQIHRCLADGTTCGKPAADAFCKLQGFDSALNFRLQHDPAQISTTIVIDSGQRLRAPEAEPFQMVKCWRPNDLPTAVQFGVSNIASPTLCDLGKDCRKSAADEWCESKGFTLGASAYEISPDKALFRSISCATL